MHDDYYHVMKFGWKCENLILILFKMYDDENF